MNDNEIDAFTTERILEAAARGEIVDGFEDIGQLLTALHEPASTSEAAASLPVTAVMSPASTRTIGRLTRRTAVGASVAVFALSGIAAAVSDGAALLNPIFGSDDPVALDHDQADDTPDEPADTVFNFGYDEQFHLLVWNTSPSDGPYDCTLEDGPVHPLYAIENGLISVDGLTTGVEGEGADVAFPDRNDETADPLLYSADGDCALDAAEVSGPNGQINHGMFMKLFNSLYEGTGRGCLNRYLARSDLGKGDQQINVSDVDPDFEPVMDAAAGEILFSTAAADCERGNNGNGHGNGNGHENGNGSVPKNNSDKGGRPDSPGRSGDAPGQNK